MNTPCYIDLNCAREALATIGVKLSHRQMKRAADIDARGRRKLPFFVDPIDRKLKIDKNMLLEIYNLYQTEAERNAHINIEKFDNIFDKKQ